MADLSKLPFDELAEAAFVRGMDVAKDTAPPAGATQHEHNMHAAKLRAHIHTQLFMWTHVDFGDAGAEQSAQRLLEHHGNAAAAEAACEQAARAFVHNASYDLIRTDWGEKPEDEDFWSEDIERLMQAIRDALARFADGDGHGGLPCP